LDLGDTGGTTNKDNFVDLGLGDVSILKHLLDGRHALAELGHAELLELGTGDVGVEVLTFCKSLAIDFSLMGRRKNSLGLLALGSKTTHGTSVALDVNTRLLLEGSDAEVDEDIVEVLTTKMGVTIGGLNFEDAVLDSQERHVKSATTKIEDEHIALALALFVETVGNGGGGGLVDDTLDVEASDGTGVLGGLTLRIVEVSGDSDDSVVHSFTEISLSDLLHLGKDHRRDLLSLELFSFALEVDTDERFLTGARLDAEGPESDVVLDGTVRELATDKTLGVEDSVCGISGGLIFGCVTDQSFFFCKGDVGGGSVDTLIVSYDFDTLVLPDTYARVGSSEIDADGSCG